MTGVDDLDTIRCTFCRNQGIEAAPGKTACPKCAAAFEVDYRVECVFTDPNNPRIPVEVMFVQSMG